MTKQPRWISQEIQILINSWPDSWKNLEKALPNKTIHAIKHKSNRIGLRRSSEKRNRDGTFKRSRRRFSLENFNDGFIDNNGRFRVWLPEHSRAYKGGYVLRSIVAYELYHDIQVPKENDIHHIDRNRLNDSKENLEMMTHKEHSTLSNFTRIVDVVRTCKHCGIKFKIKRWRLKNPSRGQYCSQKCYHSQKRGDSHRKNISAGLKKAYREGRR